MSIIKPFRGLRPKPELAAQVASPPYDVLNTEEAREMARGNDISFLHINKPEIDLPETTDPYDEKVYQKGSENLKRYIADGIFIQDKLPCFYVYRQIMGNHSQIGLVAGASVDEYRNDLIKKHELTRPVKEDDRVNHIRALNAQTGPVFLTYKASVTIDDIVSRLVKTKPVYDFRAPDGIQHTVWIVDTRKDVTAIESAFSRLDCLYVADGHHRSAAASRVCELRKAQNSNHTGEEEYNFFLSVIFPDNQMYIMDYNRVVTDLNGYTSTQLLEAIKDKFSITEIGKTPRKPSKKHTFSMYLDTVWYELEAKATIFDPSDPVDRLDVSILQKNLLHPLLGIEDPRKDKRIDFVGGIRGMQELERRVNSGEMQIAFAFFPTSIQDLMAIADAGETMPPKSTWFEPKLRSGLIIHLLD